MDKDKDMALLLRQEADLVFDQFDEFVAWKIGSALFARAVEEQLSLAIDVSLFDRALFFAATPGVVFDNHDWVKRKKNTVRRFLRSSYRVAYELAEEGKSIEERYHLSPADYVACGGSFPIIVKNIGPVGSVTVSGLPDRLDHELVIDALCDVLGKAREAYRLS